MNSEVILSHADSTRQHLVNFYHAAKLYIEDEYNHQEIRDIKMDRERMEFLMKRLSLTAYLYDDGKTFLIIVSMQEILYFFKSIQPFFSDNMTLASNGEIRLTMKEGEEFK